MRTAKVFMSGHSQAVRLPKDFQFHSREVAIERRGGKIILWEIPQNLSKAFELLGQMPDDFYPMGREDLPAQTREGFE
ncbi:MAG: antitoxin [Parachlamydiaceae bacterium]